MTSAPRSPADLSDRLAGLSPEKQALLARKLAQRADAAAPELAPIAVRARGASAPLTFAQEVLWVHAQMSPGSAAYNVPVVRRVHGPIDPDVLERALQVMVDRHESLRTRFIEENGEPRQEPMAQPMLRIERHDLRDLAVAARELAGRQLLQAAAAVPFDLAHGSVPRAVLVRLADDEALLLLVFHHIVCDGASVGIVLRELATAYDALLAGGEPAFAPLPIQLADLAVWERGQENETRLRAALDFWQPYLEDAPAETTLPADFARDPAAGAPAARTVRVMGATLRDGVGALARANGATPFMVLVAAYQTLLHRCTGQADIVIGSPIAARLRAETRVMVGHLVNTIPLRARFDGDPAFSTVLRQVRDGCLRAFEHQDVSFDRIAHAMRQRASGAGAFNVAFVQQDAAEGGAGARLGAARLEALALEVGTAKFDFTLSVTETDDGLRAALEYRGDLFDPVTAERMLSRLEVLLGAVVAAPDTAVSALPLLDATERAALAQWAVAPSDHTSDKTVDVLFDEVADRSPNAIAISAAGRTCSYAQLRSEADRVAARLQSMGVRRGDRVGLYLERSERVVVGMLGILKCGAVYVPLDPSYPLARLGLMATDAGVAVLVTERARVGQLPTAELRTLLLDEDDATPGSGLAPASNRDEANDLDLAYVMYTSGSTGQPKGVSITHRAIVRLVRGTNYVSLNESDVVAQVSTTSFDAATFEVWGALLSGARLVLIQKDTALVGEDFAAELARHGVTTLFLTTALFNQMALHAPTAFASLRHVLFGGEAVDPRAVREILARGAPGRLLHVYGPTEVTTFALWHLVTRVSPRATTIPIGQPVSSTSAYVLDGRGRLAPIGVRGELFLGGDRVASGYLNRPDLTAERFVPNPFSDEPGARMYRTGDIVRRAPDGPIEFVGRTDHQVKIRGFRIEPGEVETELSKHGAVRECVVIVHEQSPGERRLVAYVGAGETTPAELRAFLRSRLPEHMVPSAIVVLEQLPINPNGKIDRRALPSPTFDADDPVAVEPRNDIERVVAGVWSDVLGRPVTGVETSFFDLGGHSLLATRVVAQVGKIFRATLPLRVFFDAPTIAGVARGVVAAEAKPGQAAAIAELLLKIQRMTPEERERFRSTRVRPDQTPGTP